MKQIAILIFSPWFLLCSMFDVATSQAQGSAASSRVQVATFDVDVTPPIDTMMAYDRVRRIDELGLRARGIVILGSRDPIVLCAIDWLGIGNESHDIFRERIAKAAQTTPDRVAVHALHQHDAPWCDFTAERLLNEIGASELGPYNGAFAREVLDRLADTIEASMQKPQDVTHCGFGSAEVIDVASNRRILGEDGKVRAVRYTACADPELRAEPVGTIDPELSSLSFWNQDKPIAVLSYYACHPQSYYRTGIPSPDVPGIARFLVSQEFPEALHIHFNGAGGNIGAGKFNDGSKQNRLVLATRMADGMKQAYKTTEKHAIDASSIGWEIEPVAIPLAKHLNREKLVNGISTAAANKSVARADKLAWLNRCEGGHKIDLGCLRVGNVRILHMPGELFVEYQLAAKAMRPDLEVAMAAYGDYGPAYIGTKISYSEGGYETGEDASYVDESSEEVLTDAVRKLLESQN